jgi:hypothetical protein
MEWVQFFGFILTIAGLFLWSRSESAGDRKELRQSLETMNANIQAQIDIIHNDAKDFRETWADESKEFHGRLVEIEVRNRGK